MNQIVATRYSLVDLPQVAPGIVALRAILPRDAPSRGVAARRGGGRRSRAHRRTNQISRRFSTHWLLCHRSPSAPSTSRTTRMTLRSPSLQQSSPTLGATTLWCARGAEPSSRRRRRGETRRWARRRRGLVASPPKREKLGAPRRIDAAGRESTDERRPQTRKKNAGLRRLRGLVHGRRLQGRLLARAARPLEVGPLIGFPAPVAPTKTKGDFSSS